MYRIKTYNQISVEGLNRFGREKYEVSSESSAPEAILLRSHKLSVDEISDSVIAIARAGAGVNNIPIEDCSKKGVVVFNTPGANANAVKEMVVAGLLMSSRGIVQGNKYVNALKGMENAAMHKEAEAGKKKYAGTELLGKTLGVVGLGAIGARVAEIALQLGMRVIGFDPALSVEAAWRLSSEVERAENLASLMAKSDYVSLHVPSLPATRGLINQDAISQAKQGLKLLNFARPDIVDADAIVSALDTRKITTYVADFPHPAMLDRDDILLFPHLGASTKEAEDNCAVMGANQLIDFIENGNITNSVNYPAIKLERSSGYRLTFANDNVPKVLSQVLNLLADQNINVIDMLNKSRNEVAYNILDVEQKPSETLLAELANVEHVIHVRLIQ